MDTLAIRYPRQTLRRPLPPVSLPPIAEWYSWDQPGLPRKALAAPPQISPLPPLGFPSPHLVAASLRLQNVVSKQTVPNGKKRANPATNDPENGLFNSLGQSPFPNVSKNPTVSNDIPKTPYSTDSRRPKKPRPAIQLTTVPRTIGGRPSLVSLNKPSTPPGPTFHPPPRRHMDRATREEVKQDAFSLVHVANVVIGDENVSTHKRQKKTTATEEQALAGKSKPKASQKGMGISAS